MISNNILDEIFPVPELDELKEAKIQELNNAASLILIQVAYSIH